MSLDHWEILLIVFLVLLLFGAKKLPDLARGLGQSLKEFLRVTSDASDDTQSAGDVKTLGKRERDSPADRD